MEKKIAYGLTAAGIKVKLPLFHPPAQLLSSYKEIKICIYSLN